MKPWVGFALMSMFFAGLTSVIAKLGLAGISGELGLVVRTAVITVLVAGFALVFVPVEEWSRLGWRSGLWLALSGLTTTLSWIFYYKALKQGDVATVALIDKGSILVAVVLAVFILKERVTWNTLGGGVLIVAGLLWISRK
ncbi:MAG: EamA family transporter [Candidatus Methylacidiphilales bacterium]|nr:EamA family transporter [Candidatus Methylacidiphilales bacterium]